MSVHLGEGGSVTCLPPNTNPPNQQAGGEGQAVSWKPAGRRGIWGACCSVSCHILISRGWAALGQGPCPALHLPFPGARPGRSTLVQAQQMIPGRRNRRMNQ